MPAVTAASCRRAPLRCAIDGRVGPVSGRRSDRPGEFGERYGDAESAWGVDAKFVVAAAEILHERVPGDDRLRGPVSP
jgi:hypothetical protein